jgi:hypothetical protein
MIQQQEQALLASFRQMTERDKLWILALSNRCVNAPQKIVEEVFLAVRYTDAEQPAKH